MKPTTPRSFTRRKFIASSVGGIALFNILPGTLLRGAQAVSPNEKLNVAGIGIGGQGGHDVNEVAALGHNMVALCDVSDKHAAKQFEKYPNAKRFKDYR